MSRNPDWTKDEVILALDLYFEAGKAWLPDEHPDVIELSTFLRELELFPSSVRLDNFRSPNGISMKLANFMALDPDYHGKGLSAQSKLDVAVWNEFSQDPQNLSEIAKAIRVANAQIKSDIASEFSQYVTIEDDFEYPEGRLLTYLHKVRERNSDVVYKKKQKTLRDKGVLLCEVCNFDFAETYGEIGIGFAECHHKIPLSALKDIRTTKVSDLAIVCANCHRMLHTARPVLTVEALHKIVMDTRSHRES